MAAEPPELINTVLSKLADRINQARTATELAERAGAYCRLGYVYRAMENENNDYGRRQLRLRPLSDQNEALTGAGRRRRAIGDDDEDRRNLALLLQTLRNRAERATPRATCLTTLHVRCWQAVVAGHGAQATLARELKVDPSRISQIKSSATAKVRETLYIAGVLGQPGTLSDADRIHACLDVYDVTAGPARALTTEQRARLATAALAVKVSPANGQRADSRAAADRYLRRKDKKGLREKISCRRPAAAGIRGGVRRFAARRRNCPVECDRSSPSELHPQLRPAQSAARPHHLAYRVDMSGQNSGRGFF